jgi:hypothetical protein
MNFKPLGWGTLCALLLLVACGGGSGDDGVQVPQGIRSGAATQGSNISESNVRSFAGPLARAVMRTGDGQVPGISGGREAPQARATPSALQAQRWVRLALAHASSREQLLATTTRTVPCLAGSLRITADDDDNNGKLSAGDRISITANACISELGQPASTGSLSLRINGVELDAQDDATALDVTVTFSGFEEDGFGSLSGSMRIWFKDDGAGGERLRVSYRAAVLTEQGDSFAYDFDITGGSGANGGGTFDMNGTFVIGGAGYAMSSTTFEFSAGSHPTKGSVTLRDIFGNTVTLRAKGDTFDLEFRPFGAPFPLIIPGFLWSAQRLGPG